jgi:uncharacterized protein YggE
MKNLSIPVALLLAVASCSAAAQGVSGKPFLAVQGHAESRVKPDLFPVSVTLSDMGMDGGKSQAMVEGLAKQVLAAAQKQQVADADLEVGNLSVSPETKWNEDKDTEVFLGNTYERELKVRFHSLDALRAFIADLPAGRQVQIETDTFEYSKAAELKRQLRRDAIDDARRGAEDMASAVGKRLVDLQSVSDKAQAVSYSASGYAYEPGALGKVQVTGARVGRTSDIVLREGEILVSADAYLIYVMGD